MTELTELERVALAWRKADKAWRAMPHYEPIVHLALNVAEGALREVADRVSAERGAEAVAE